MQQEFHVIASDDYDLDVATRTHFYTKNMNDPSRFGTSQTTTSPPPIPKQVVVLASPVQGSPPN